MIKKIIFVLLYWASVIGLIFVLAVTVGLAVDEAAFIAAFFFVLFVLIVVIKIHLARKRKKLKKKFSEAAELMNEGHVKDFDAVIRQQILMKKRKKSTSGKRGD